MRFVSSRSPRVRGVFVACALMALEAATASDRVVVDLPLPAPAVEVGAESSTGESAPPPLPVSQVGESGVTPAPRRQPADVSEEPTALQATDTSPSADPSPPALLTLEKGQSLYHLFAKNGFEQGSLVTMVRQDRRIKRTLRRLRPGQRIRVTELDGKVQEMVLERSGPTELIISRGDDDRFRMRETNDVPAPATRPAVPRQADVVEMSVDSVAAERQGEAIEPPESTSEGATEEPLASDPVGVRMTDPTAAQRVTVKRGDSLFRIFRRLGIPPQDLARLMDADQQAHGLRDLRPGQELILGVTHDKRLHSLSVELDEERTLTAVRSADDGYQVTIDRQALERRVTTASAVIENSLFLAGQRAGLSDRVIMSLTEIFGWDVDFALDVRAGDRFTVIYEELYKNGEKVRDGPILASEFFNRGRSVRAIRFVDDTGRSSYYSPEGLSMRKAFLRTPVRFSRISSRFSTGRMHPVLQRMRAHKGVDYAAPTGTEIEATGDGRVVFSGSKGGYGRTVIIQHGSTYTTLYAHMSRIHRRARQGQRVRQGDVIGYVGSSGLATGPHLHYEFRVRGRHADPLRVKLPKALPIEARFKAKFQRASRALVSQLDTLASTSLAARD